MKQVNSELLLRLRTYLEENPDQRFTQALFNIGVAQGVHRAGLHIDYIDYNEPSRMTLDRVNKQLNKEND